MEPRGRRGEGSPGASGGGVEGFLTADEEVVVVVQDDGVDVTRHRHLLKRPSPKGKTKEGGRKDEERKEKGRPNRGEARVRESADVQQGECEGGGGGVVTAVREWTTHLENGIETRKILRGVLYSKEVEFNDDLEL